MCFCLARVIVIGTRDYLKNAHLFHIEVIIRTVTKNDT